jgi:KDO2-lipid IV(A) lauroyltransferase
MSAAQAFEYLTYLAVSRVASRWRHETVRRTGRRLGKLWHRVDAKHRRLAERNIQQALPELGEDERRRVVRACYEHFGSTFLEILRADVITAEELEQRFLIEGWDHVEAARERGNGVFMLCGHYGSWQMAIYPIGHRLGGMHVVARAHENPRIAADLHRLRERFGNVEVPRGGGGYAVLKVIRNGGVVGMVVDHRVPPLTGIIVPFLGLPARSTRMPAMVALRTGAAAVPMTCTPIDDSRYRIVIREPILPTSVDGSENPEAALTIKYLETVEREIRQRPELWMWMRDRWQLRDSERQAFEAGSHELTTVERAEIRRQTGWRPGKR